MYGQNGPPGKAFPGRACGGEAVSVIRQVAAGGTVVSADIRSLLAEDPPVQELTDRQIEILDSVTRKPVGTDPANAL